MAIRAVFFLFLFTTGLFTSGMMLRAIAQVTSDGTTNTIVKQSGNNFTILNGANKGNNLFHSFSNFSVPTGAWATFDLSNTPDIKTIFSRVTGGNISYIDGLISTVNSNGPVSLFLMNPSGIVFGQNASLNIGGSFIGTTANSIKFADGTEFSAANRSAVPLLTMSVPVGLQMGQNPGTITVQNTGHRIASGSAFTPANRSQNPIGLQVKLGNTLALIGGEVNFSGGIISTKGGGHLEVGSVSDGFVGLNPIATGWLGDYSAVQQFNDIHFAQKSLVDASGFGGSTQVQGRNISLTESSAVWTYNFGQQPAGEITVKATEALKLTGQASTGLVNIIAIDNFGSGQAGDVNITAGQLYMNDASQISARTFTPAPGGNIKINVAGLINIDGFPSITGGSSSILTFTANSANAGNITVSSSNLKLENGGGIFTLTGSSGQTGTLRVNVADLIDIAGNNPISLAPSALNSSTFSSGKANNVFVNTSRLLIRDGGALGSTTLAKGEAGSVIVNAAESVALRGKSVNSIVASRIVSSAEILDPATQAKLQLPPVPSGNSASLSINTPSLRVADGAYISVKNDGPGSAGDLLLNANSVFLDNQGAISASTASGNGGNIKLNLQDYLLMRHHSFISATAAGNGNGGNLSINAPIILGLENSDIIANAVQGRGGNINIATQGIIGLAFRNTLTPHTDPTNDITASSEFNVNGTVQINNFGVNPNSGLVELPTNVTDPSQQIATGCASNQGSSFMATGRGGIRQNPNQQIGSDVYDGLRLRTWSDIRDISAYRKTGSVTAQTPPSSETLIQATGWHRNAQGKVELVANKSSAQVQPSLTCAAVKRS